MPAYQKLAAAKPKLKAIAKKRAGKDATRCAAA